jgi:hypothetical protein
MRKQLLVPVSMTEKMYKHFKELPFEKDGELALPTQRTSSEDRYLNNFVKLGLLYEVPISWSDMGYNTTFYITIIGETIRNCFK